jgi:chromosome segregation ATPase
MGGFGYVAGQAAVLLVLAAVLGVAAGWLARSLDRRPEPALQRELDDARHEADELRIRVAELTGEVQAVSDRTEAEMGRLESGAIATLESVITNHRRRIDALELQLRDARIEVRNGRRQLDHEQLRNSRLEAVITQRDERMAQLSDDAAEREQRTTGSA